MSTDQLLRLCTFAAVLLFGGSKASADLYTFLPDPASGDIQGPAGSTIGWGYSITNNDPTNWLVLGNVTADPLADATPNSSLFDFPVIAPGATVSLPFDSVSGTGLYALTWDSSAPLGFTNNGVFTLDAEWWTGDPFAGGAFIRDATPETAAYTATVTAAVPEPRSLWLLAPVLLALFRLGKRMRAQV